MDLVRGLFEPQVRVAAMDPARADIASLAPDEARDIARAVDKRRREYAAGRILARTLMGELGVAPQFALVRRPDGAPGWPPGIVGSITHTRSAAAVAVASTDHVASLGLDLEVEDDAALRVWSEISTERERSRLDARPPSSRARLAKAVFSAKEAVYKAQHPLTGVFLGFGDVEVELDPDGGRFSARLGRAAGPLPAGHTFAGRLRFGEGLIGTSVVVHHAP